MTGLAGRRARARFAWAVVLCGVLAVASFGLACVPDDDFAAGFAARSAGDADPPAVRASPNALPVGVAPAHAAPSALPGRSVQGLRDAVAGGVCLLI
jgi:hypothetical protein